MTNAVQQRPAPTVCLGAPRFAAPALAALAKAEGALAAIRRAVADDPRTAAATVSGHFAIGFESADEAFIAVDRFSVHSLCYRIVDGRLRFAARADELAALAPTAELDPQALFDYLYFHVIPAPRTAFAGVFRLPPGHYAHYRDGRLAVEPYWVATFDEPTPRGFDELSAEFRTLLRESVARQLDGTRPACFLSGGTDSSTVAGLIGEVAGVPAATYSIGFEAEGYDEMAFARIAAQRFGTDHHEYYVTPADLVTSIPAVAAHHDQPFGNSSALPAYYCTRLAQADGVGRLLAGDGGDELFGGNTRYAKQRIFGWYGRVPAGLRGSLIEPVLGRPGAARLPLLRKAASYVEQARVPLPERMQMYNLLLRLQTSAVLTPGFLARVDPAEPLRHQRAVWQQARTDSALNRMLAFDWRYTLADTDVPKVRGAAEMAGITAGFPLLDPALVDFSMRLPTDYKLKGLKLRWFFKEALRGFLPDEIITKKKQGFGLPFGVWATRHAPLRQLADESLRSLATRGIVQPEFLRTLLEVHLPAHPGYYGEMVWILMMLEQWLQAHAPSTNLQGT